MPCTIYAKLWQQSGMLWATWHHAMTMFASIDDDACTPELNDPMPDMDTMAHVYPCSYELRVAYPEVAVLLLRLMDDDLPGTEWDDTLGYWGVAGVCGAYCVVLVHAIVWTDHATCGRTPRHPSNPILSHTVLGTSQPMHRSNLHTTLCSKPA